MYKILFYFLLIFLSWKLFSIDLKTSNIIYMRAQIIKSYPLTGYIKIKYAGGEKRIRVKDIEPFTIVKKDGSPIYNIKILNLTPIDLEYQSGDVIKTIKLKDLSKEYQEFFNYNKKRAKKYLKKRRIAMRKAEIRRKKLLKKRKEMKEFNSMIFKRNIHTAIFQATNEGSLIHGDSFFLNKKIFVYGITNQIYTDKQIIDTTIYSCGNYSYTNLYGATVTTYAFTTSKKDAIRKIKKIIKTSSNPELLKKQLKQQVKEWKKRWVKYKKEHKL